jgi:hypothetical protein
MGGVGGALMGLPDPSTLNVRNVGTLTLDNGKSGNNSGLLPFNASSHLNITNVGTVEGAIDANHLTINGGTVANATLYTTIGFHNGVGDLNLGNTTLGPKVTLTLASGGDPPSAQTTTAEIGNVTSLSDTINVDIGTVTLEKPLSFLRPPPETINFADSLYATTINELVFKTDPFTAASYANGALDLKQGAHDFLFRVNFQGASPSQFALAESPASHGLVTAILQPFAGNGSLQPILPAPGSTIVHITT